MRNPDIIPRADDKFNTLQDIIIIKTTAKAAKWKIPLARINELLPLQAAWVSAWDKAKVKNTRSTAQVTAKNEARKKYLKELRPFIQKYIQLNSNMTDAERMNCGIKPRSKTRTRVAVPDTVPLVQILMGNAHQYFVYFRQEAHEAGSSSRRKPTGIELLEMFYLVDSKPKSPDDCTKHFHFRKNGEPVNFPASYRGKTIYYYVRWLNTRLEPGPWSRLQTLEVR